MILEMGQYSHVITCHHVRNPCTP